MKVAVLMSGGVDSTVAACLLKEKGYEVIGLTMVNWDTGVGEKAQKAASALGLEHIVVDMKEIFQEKVVAYFCRSYEKGETPNPCVECNKYIKFGKLLDIALDLGCEKVATGHYARVEYDEEKNRYLLRQGRDKNKDQSYFLYGLKQRQLERILFPLGDFTKPEVREMARAYGLEVAESKESQEVCFIAGDYRDFLRDKVSLKPGDFVDLKGRVIGTHKGIPFYTVGQRKGLGLSMGKPVYVLDLDVENNRIIVDEEVHLFRRVLYAADYNFIMFEELEEDIRVLAKVRYRSALSPATVSKKGDRLKVEFDQPQRAITRGQSVVFYQGEYVLGGGIIADIV
ncbi:tRNA (5-methylaminomethyl-2-thiouridylate)-methyltransferase [Thermosyntropha lipolytica DSM 11003]|uniref:tRNA-specific 2-thiouridylase MnmA n=1 Tax=Thermosyntropha lipolytica DSM 11003 TaxID=1123382 RepID=A0A1M5MVR2_9FIRM|nr:tRNA 2-thiouridine(34) synthase MnmA [Thermosyntropha lipolytica]SHG80999.1 tRNA (5-methylaminomethyl-2-thiouridylate)-methyltransferase [Thermosyntropha lipolytica DSM 11003]